jgi:IS605 OrfB family transposase
MGFVYNVRMKLTVRIRLTPDAEQATRLRAMMRRFNAAADWIAGELFARGLSNKIEAQRLLYHEIRRRFDLFRRMRDKEAQFRRHENHVISRRIVESASRTGRGIALEDLEGIRERVTARGGDAHNRLSGWAFAQLGRFIGYKAKLAGIPVVFVDPRDTSRTCAECGHREKANRRSQGEFLCKGCGHEDHADANAARNIRCRALAATKPAIGLGNPRATGWLDRKSLSFRAGEA